MAIHTGTGSPNGSVTAAKADLYVDTTTPGLWQNTNGATAWTDLTSGLPAQWTDGSHGDVIATVDDVTKTPVTIEGKSDQVGGTGTLFKIVDGNGNVVANITSDGDLGITGLFAYIVESDGNGGYQRTADQPARFDPNGPGILMNQRAGQNSIMLLQQGGANVFEVQDGGPNDATLKLTSRHDDAGIRWFHLNQTFVKPFLALVSWFDDGSDVFTSLEITKQGALDLHEQHDTPAAPAANTARIYCRDTGGKSQLVVRFPSGAVQVLATEP